MKLKQVVVSTDPYISVFPDFLSDVECDHLIDLVEGYWTPSLVGNKESQDQDSWGRAGEYDNSATDYRTSWSCFLRWCQTSVVERMEQRVADIGKLWLPVDVSQVERMNMVRYAPGERFRVHHDGKFRPITVFIYLNDLPENDEGGTYFPILGYSFKPRKGTAIMWRNNSNDGSEDSRMIHAGEPPLTGIKYGVNCFINGEVMRELVSTPALIPVERAVVQRVCDWSEESPALGENGLRKLQIYVVFKNPKIFAMPGFLTAEEIENILRDMGDLGRASQNGPFAASNRTLHQFDFAASPTIAAIENRCCLCVDDILLDHGINVNNLAKLRVVRPATELGLCDRGCGKVNIYVCLGKADEVFLPRLGLRFILGPGDALSIPSVNFETGLAREEMRTVRVHRVQDGEEPPIGLNCFFHDDPVRLTQNTRKFVIESDLR